MKKLLLIVKIFLIINVVISILFFISNIYNNAYEITQLWINEKVFEYENHLKILADRIGKNYELGFNIYENNQIEKLADSLSDLDGSPMIYATLLTYDGTKFMDVSQRIPENESYFDPISHDDFARAALTSLSESRNEPNTIIINIDNAAMHTSYLWAPFTGNAQGTDYLMVTALSEHSLQADYPTSIYVIQTLRLLWTCILTGFFLWVIIKIDYKLKIYAIMSDGVIDVE